MSSHYYIQFSVDSINECLIDNVMSKFKQVEWVKSNGLIIEAETPPTNDHWFVSKAYKSIKSDEIFIRPRIAISLKKGYSEDCILSQNKYKNVLRVNRAYGNVYIFDCIVSTSDEVLDISMLLHEEPEVEWSEPIMSAELVLCNTKYPQQYYLKNTGQGGGTPGIDINVEPAWLMTTGSPNITVAVLDVGVDQDHEDLANCVLDGYTINNPSGYGAPVSSSDAHGIACAGIIAATDNSIGIKGIAHGVKVLPVNVFPSTIPDPDEMADAIRWAYPRADVISCSWYFTDFNCVRAAINDAMTYGRNGKGTIVVCAAGNEGINTINFPASMDGTIAVGAIDKYGSVWSYSNKGTKLDLVAPSGYYVEGAGDVVTTDRMGALGYTTSGDWNYTEKFGGTSAACPQVAGIVALMLSINPNLTADEVSNILKSSAKKLLNYTYVSGRNNETGYGLVDAEKSVFKAAQLSISGSTVPENPSIYSVTGLGTATYPVTWSWQTPCSIPIVQNSPSTNQCTISNPNKDYINNVLVATITYDAGTSRTIEKVIHTGANFSGTYSQEGGQVIVPFGSPIYHDPIPTTPFADQSYVRVHTVQTFTLTSSMFSSSTLTSEDGSFPTGWNQNGNTITYNYPRLGGPSIHVIGRSNTGYDVYKFTVKVIPDLIDPGLPILSPGNGTLTISLGDEQSEDGISRSTETDLDELAWDVEIVNVLTGDIAYKGSFKGRSQTISTNGWTSGFYVVHIDINGVSISRKIYIK